VDRGLEGGTGSTGFLSEGKDAGLDLICLTLLALHDSLHEINVFL